MVRPLQPVADRDLAADQVDQRGRDEEGADAPRAALLQDQRRLGDGLQPADAGADLHPGPLLLLLGFRLVAGIRERLGGGGDAEDDEGVVLAEVLRLDIVGGVEQAGPFAARHVAGDPGRQVTGLEAGDRADARLAGHQIRP